MSGYCRNPHARLSEYVVNLLSFRSYILAYCLAPVMCMHTFGSGCGCVYFDKWTGLVSWFSVACVCVCVCVCVCDGVVYGGVFNLVRRGVVCAVASVWWRIWRCILDCRVTWVVMLWFSVV